MNVGLFTLLKKATIINTAITADRCAFHYPLYNLYTVTYYTSLNCNNYSQSMVLHLVKIPQ